MYFSGDDDEINKQNRKPNAPVYHRKPSNKNSRYPPSVSIIRSAQLSTSQVGTYSYKISSPSANQNYRKNLLARFYRVLHFAYHAII